MAWVMCMLGFPRSFPRSFQLCMQILLAHPFWRTALARSPREVYVRASGRQDVRTCTDWVWRSGCGGCGVGAGGAEWVRSGCGVGAEWARRRRSTAARPPDTAALPAASTRSCHGLDTKGDPSND